MLEINDMLSQCEDDKEKGYLLLLKAIGNQIDQIWSYLGKTFKQKYHALMRRPEWKNGRLVSFDYHAYKNGGHIICSICGKEVFKKSFTLHHRDYYPKNPYDLTVPLYTEIIHNACHRKGDPRKW